MNDHMITMHAVEKEHTCNICEAKFGLLNRLKRHLKDTHGPRKRCDMCDKTFKTKGTLKRYIDTSHS